MPKLAAAGIPAMLICAGATHAETRVPEIPVLSELDRIVVTATLNERAQKDVANEVSVIEAAEVDRRQSQSVADLLRYEPGVSASGSAVGGGRFGQGGISIRGLSGNRVRIELDGVAIPDSFEIGSFSSAGRDVVDVDVLKRVEIIRGASSSLYGSDALAGVVSYVTKDPVDFVGPQGGQYLSGKLLYDTANRGSALTGTWAAGSQANGLVLVATHREGAARNNRGEIDSADSTRTRPNPQDTRSDAVLAKYVHTAESGRVDRLSFDGERGDVETDVLSSRLRNPLTGASTTALLGDDSRERLRLGFDQEFTLSSPLADSLDWRVNLQRSSTTQDSFEDRVTVTAQGPVNPNRRFRRFEFEQQVLGVEASARKALSSGSVDHAITYGIDLTRTSTDELRDGWQLDLTTGAMSNVVMPDVYPVRDFPKSKTTNAALFVQDEMGLLDGRLSLIPALRVDHYRLDPEVDATFAEDNPGVAVDGLNSTSWSPKLGMIWRWNPSVSMFAQYAHGFRAPPYNDVNLGFTNLAFGYTSMPNPDLKPESSNGLEIGLRAQGASGWLSVSTYENRYRDFIESMSFVGVDPQSGLMLFQSVNVGRVRIRGAEARFGLELGSFNDALDGWLLKGSLAHARGDDRGADEPLISVDPMTAVLGLAYEGENWGAELITRMVGRKDRLPEPSTSIDPTQPPPTPLFEAPGHATIDFYAHWQAMPHLELFGALTNIGNRRYWDWGTVAGFSERANIDLYSAPGRAIRLGLRTTF